MTSNEEFLDAMIRHQIYMMRLSGSVRNRIFDLLEDADRDLRMQLRDGLTGLAGPQGLTPARSRRLEALLRRITALRTRAWEAVEAAWVEEMLELAVNEPTFVAGVIQTTAPVIVSFNPPSGDRLRAIVEALPFEGRTLRDWASSIRTSDIERIQAQIRIGMVQGETIRQISGRIVGTARNRGRDGVTQITRRNAEAITRTAVNHVSNQARSEFFAANAEFFDIEQYVSTLDTKTTAVCRAYDGKRYKRGKGPIPPLHFNCRSLRVAVLNDTVFGSRPMKPVTERMLLREFARENDLGNIRSRADLPRGTRGNFDRFAQARTRQLVGRVPASTDYGTFLRRQSVEFQNDTLGVAKARLFREGNLPLDKFINRAGDELSLSQLASRHASAFRAAGLDPEDFL